VPAVEGEPSIQEEFLQQVEVAVGDLVALEPQDLGAGNLAAGFE